MTKRLLAVVRFLNLLEPGKRILSITKTAMWLCVIGLGVALFTSRPVDLPTLLAFFTTASLYAWRRFVQWKTGTILGDPTEPSLPPDQPAG
ncbi:hypothetical protein SAMN02983003_0611 [Devosia enhydra]|uniref:Uncharacterized protein n=1 Tax=Devosia enhydra TaxID=665118 RepID=A0A1K2HTU0_9HYPH|nr:hypothetical protein [Devosia enhydra]SFZ81643.1 hypothetical protein SAMN02983003_0611 [Devosia enhydra]